jgi:very-short-patch-repair endonuclease
MKKSLEEKIKDNKRRTNQIKVRLYSKRLKYNPTNAEKVLYDRLESNNIKFQFQKEVFNDKKSYILDFFFRRINNRPLVVEVDGKSHASMKAIKYDASRTLWLKKHRNYEVVRFMNEEILANVQGIVDKIIKMGAIKRDLVKEFVDRTNGNWLE